MTHTGPPSPPTRPESPAPPPPPNSPPAQLPRPARLRKRGAARCAPSRHKCTNQQNSRSPPLSYSYLSPFDELQTDQHQHRDYGRTPAIRGVILGLLTRHAIR